MSESFCRAFILLRLFLHDCSTFYFLFLAFIRILRSTWQKLKALNNQKDKELSEVLKESMSTEPLAPILTQKHFDAIDRRLKMIVKQVNECIKKHGEKIVVVDDQS